MDQTHYYPYSNNYPQVAYTNLPLSKPAGYSDLEATPSRINAPSRPITEKDDGRRICGFRVATFWLSLALITVIVIAAVAGGVGGGFASSDSAGSASHTTTKTVAATSTAPPTTTSSTPASGIARNYCTNHTIYTTPTGSQFTEYCAIDWAATSDARGGGEVYDLAVKKKGSYQACMDECAIWNQENPKGNHCGAISFNADLTNAIAAHDGNCWLKNKPGLATTLIGYVNPEMYSVAALNA